MRDNLVGGLEKEDVRLVHCGIKYKDQTKKAEVRTSGG